MATRGARGLKEPRQEVATAAGPPARVARYGPARGPARDRATASRTRPLPVPRSGQRTDGTTEIVEAKEAEEARKLAAFSADEGLRQLADLAEVTISLEHLSHVDAATRIVVGARLDYAPEESEWLHRTKELEEPEPEEPEPATLQGAFVIPGDGGEPPPTGAC